MPTYTLLARNRRTLVHAGREYRDGDTITLAKADAEQIALDSSAFRFVPKAGGDEISTASLDAATAPPAQDARKVVTPTT